MTGMSRGGRGASDSTPRHTCPDPEDLEGPVVCTGSELAYGYVNCAETPDHVASEVERELRAWSGSGGVVFVSVFVETQPGAQRAFEELLSEVTRAGARFVVVPGFEHFATHPLLQLQMADRLVRRTGAEIIDMSDYTEYTTGRAGTGPDGRG